MSDSRIFPDIEFVSADAETILAEMVSDYETAAGKTLYPATPERLLILWGANMIVQERVLINEIAKQNLPRYANGDFLDSLAELFKNITRLEAQASTTTIRFNISEALESAQLIPLGTRIATIDGKLTFATTQAVSVAIGSTYADVPAKCETAGDAGNGFTPGQISQIVDVFPYFSSCANTTTSTGGSDEETDDAFYARMRESADAYSTAGSIGGYIYFAKSVSSEIVDVAVSVPSAGHVDVYLLMDDGALPDEETLTKVTAALSADEVRPATDYVTVLAPSTVSYDINVTYYITTGTTLSEADIATAVAVAVEKYKAWQCSKLGRAVNPSKLISLLMGISGINRVEVTSPVQTAVGNTAVAAFGTQTITNGGYENE